jgi:Zn-finger nucleic acid-binding protein
VVYRDRPLACPRCGDELVRRAAHDRWRCVQCRGAALTTAELVRGLLALAPELLRDGRGPVTLTNERRPVTAPVPCPACGDAMDRVLMGHVDIDRCFRDDMLWFDDWEHVAVVAATRDRDKHHWLRALLATLFPASER